MSLKKLAVALILASATALAWLGMSAVPAAAAVPSPSEVKQLDAKLGLHAKKHHGKMQHHKKGKKGKKGGKGHHKKHKKA